MHSVVSQTQTCYSLALFKFLRRLLCKLPFVKKILALEMALSAKDAAICFRLLFQDLKLAAILLSL